MFLCARRCSQISEQNIRAFTGSHWPSCWSNTGSFTDLNTQKQGESSDIIRKRVINARKVQAERYKNNPGIYCNAQMNSKLMKEVCAINTPGQSLLKTAIARLNLSARAYDRILKVSRTIADLAESESIQPEHLAEAITYRNLDREGWGG